MGLIENIFRNTKTRSFQTKNEAVFAYLREHGFSLPAIRWALMDLNDINLGRLTNGHSIATASNTIAGRRSNKQVMEALSSMLDMPVETLFPGEG